VHLQHHNSDNDSDHTVTERLHAVGGHLAVWHAENLPRTNGDTLGFAFKGRARYMRAAQSFLADVHAAGKFG
jgi:hypothetical protein